MISQRHVYLIVIYLKDLDLKDYMTFYVIINLGGGVYHIYHMIHYDCTPIW